MNDRLKATWIDRAINGVLDGEKVILPNPQATRVEQELTALGYSVILKDMGKDNLSICIGEH